MKTMAMVVIAVIVVLAIAAYMLFGSGTSLTIPSSSPAQTTETPSATTGGDAAAQPEINDAGAATASEEAATSTGEVADEIGSVDALEIPDV